MPSPDLLQSLDTRRSTPSRQLGPPGPDDATLLRMLRTAVRVPDHGKLVPFRFLRIHGDARHALGEALVARALELARVVPLMEDWLRALRPTEPFCVPSDLPDEGSGMGLSEAARGSLGHWVVVRRGRIDRLETELATLQATVARLCAELGVAVSPGGPDEAPGRATTPS